MLQPTEHLASAIHLLREYSLSRFQVPSTVWKLRDVLVNNPLQDSDRELSLEWQAYFNALMQLIF